MTADTSQTERIGSGANQTQIFLQNFPPIPDDVKKRFPSMISYERSLKEWIRKATFQIQGGG